MKHELLAPAGNLDIFYAVIWAGADAVYIGGPKFGARAYAQNFTDEEILSAILYAHLHGVKVYMTVNTLVKNEELEDCIRMMVPFYEAGLDGVILQDMGVVRAFSRHFPMMELHASTQMSISNVSGAKLLKQSGISRVVTSRELSLQEVQEIREKAGVEVECFIHGALCYCYSGQCLMSSMIGGRSGNRGRCAQPCRLPYEVLEEDGTVRKSTSTILSLKDLCTIDFLPDLLEAGIDSLKIEGRMKQASYAYTVVSIYRKYLDLYEKYGREGYQVSKEDYQKLLDSGNREGFTDGYFYQHNGKHMLTLSGSAHNSSAGELDEKAICEPMQLPVTAHAILKKGRPACLALSDEDHKITIEGAVVEQARTCGMTEEKIKTQLSKTGGSYLYFQELTMDMDPDIFLPVSELNQLRRSAIDRWYETMTDGRIYEKVSEVRKQSASENRPITISVLASDFHSLNVVLEKDYVQRVYVELLGFSQQESSECRNLLKQCKERQIEVFGAYPYVLRKNSETLLRQRLEQFSDLLDGVLVRSYDGLAFAADYELPIIADEMLYTYSEEASEMLYEQNVVQDTLPFELSERELKKRDNHAGEWVIYGRLPVMISAGCVHKNTGSCDKQRGFLNLKDRKNYCFPVYNECNACYNVIYNSTPTCLFNAPLDSTSLGCKSVRLQFTTETREQIEQVLALLEKQVLHLPTPAQPLKDFTWGHFRKGVL